MKNLLIIYLNAFLLSCSPSQKINSIDNMKQKDSIITDNNSLLNEEEGAFLNKIFETTRKDFDFMNKKIGFIKISGEKGKVNYFDMQKNHSINENYPCDNGELYIFNTAQKAESGGYDAAIVYWSKFLIPADNVVKRLKEKRR